MSQWQPKQLLEQHDIFLRGDKSVSPFMRKKRRDLI
nr:MAG TPA: hypothetical protein [Caudoviricetes sp.]